MSVLFPSLFPRTIQLTIVHRQNEREVVYCNILHSFVWEGVIMTQSKQFTGTPDWFFTNRSKLITLSQLPMVGSSDHYTILAKPVSAPITTHTTEKSVVRDMRDSAWRAFGRWITQKDWTPILNASSCEQKFQLLMSELDGAISIFLPQKISKKHPTDRPWITSKIKMWIGKRQSAFSRHGKDSGAYRHWRNKVQGAIKTAKHHYYQEKVAEVEHVNPEKWWRDIKKLAGQVAKQEWYHQFLDKDTDIKRLANKINSYFVGLTDHFPPLCQGVPPLSVPDELLISEYEAYKSLSSLQTSKAVGPDNIPNRILKDFALELAPLVCDIYNQSLREGYIPALLKSSIVTPIPKVSPPALIEQDLRPISLTCTLAKVMEGFTCSRLLPQLEGKIDPCQFSSKRHSTTDALIYMLQAIYEAVDSSEASARIFFADFSKGFDLIDHSILMQ